MILARVGLWSIELDKVSSMYKAFWLLILEPHNHSRLGRQGSPYGSDVLGDIVGATACSDSTCVTSCDTWLCTCWCWSTRITRCYANRASVHTKCPSVLCFLGWHSYGTCWWCSNGGPFAMDVAWGMSPCLKFSDWRLWFFRLLITSPVLRFCSFVISGWWCLYGHWNVGIYVFCPCLVGDEEELYSLKIWIVRKAYQTVSLTTVTVGSKVEIALFTSVHHDALDPALTPWLLSSS